MYKKNQKTQKTQKNPLGWVYLKKRVFFQPWSFQINIKVLQLFQEIFSTQKHSIFNRIFRHFDPVREK
jgi:hypothetical protein